MKKERKRKIWIVSIAVVFCVAATVLFLFSVKHLLLSEEKLRLSDINQLQSSFVAQEIRESRISSDDEDIIILKNHNNLVYFDQLVYSYITDNEGNVIAAFGEEAAKKAKENDKYFGQFCKGQNAMLYRLHVQEDENRVEKMQTITGENVYVAVVCNEIGWEGYIITIVNQSIINRETTSTFHLAISVVVLAFICLTVGAIYSINKVKWPKGRNHDTNRPDEITGLSQYPLHKAIAQKLISSESHEFAYVSLAINKYVLISELNGKEYCHALLRNIAQKIAEQMEEDETLSHVEEEYFGMLLIYPGELQFRQRLVRMLKHAGNTNDMKNNFCNITFHAGVCIVGKETDINRVIHHAIKARSGKIQQNIASITFYQNKEELQEYRHKLAQEVSDAIYQQQFCVYFQPKYQMKTDELAGAEALIRWNHPTYGLIYPNIFLPILEENDMISQVDYYMIRGVCEYMRGWIADGLYINPISINISSSNLLHSTFVQEIAEIVDTFEIPHHLIEFEFDENAVYEQQEVLTHVMKQLESLGFILSVDNLGAGFSAFHLMKELPIHIIKMDKELIRDLDDVEFSDKERTIVTHIISYAKERNWQVVAEGVETKKQRDVLQEQECDMVQGFYYNKPMPPEEYRKLLVPEEK